MFINIRKNGIKKYHLGDIHLAESLSMPSYKNAVNKFTDMGIIEQEIINEKKSEYRLTDVEKANELIERINGFV